MNALEQSSQFSISLQRPIMEAPTSATERDRYEIEFEFVQNLANVGYLQFLAQEKILEDAAFIRYLEYLRYWKRPEYLIHLRFPQCLAFLDALIDNVEFRREIGKMDVCNFVHQQQAKHWMQGRTIHTPKEEAPIEDDTGTVTVTGAKS